MTTFRIAKRDHFTVVSNDLVADEQLSFRARGVLIWLLSKPDDWRCSADNIARAGTEGRDAVRSALKELVARGYILREKHQDDKGQWQTSYTVYETPGHTEDGIPVVGNPASGSPSVGSPGALTKTETEDCDQTSSARSRSQELFDEYFWPEFRAASERPGSRGDAWKAWTKLTMKERHEALEGIERHRTMIIQFPGRFVMPNGSTWLNKKRWMDDMPQEPPRQNGYAHPGMDKLRSMMNNGALHGA